MTASPRIKSIRQPAQAASTIKTIVVATDFSGSAAAAVGYATQLAKAHGARIVVVHVVDTELQALAEEHGPVGEHVCRELKAVEAIVVASEVPVRTIHQIGKPWKVIAEVARNEQADLIVVGAHGKSKFSERVLGTVAQQLIKRTSTPVLVHRDLKRQAVREVRTVLAATDFSEEAALAISTVVRLLRGTGDPARLVLLHAVSLPVAPVDVNVPMPIFNDRDEAEDAAARRLETLAASLRSDQLQVEVKTLRGFPAEAVLHEAEFIDADIIAIGTVGRTGLRRFFMGSVAEQVLHQANCPVLTVRRPDANEPIQVSPE